MKTFDEAMKEAANLATLQVRLTNAKEAIPTMMENPVFVGITIQAAEQLLLKVLQASGPEDAVIELCTGLCSHFELGRMIGIEMEKQEL